MAIYTKKALEEMRSQLTEDTDRTTKAVRKTDRPYFMRRNRVDTISPLGVSDPVEELMAEFSSRSATIVRQTSAIANAKSKNRKPKEEVVDLSPTAEAGEVQETTGKLSKGADKLLQNQAFMKQLAIMQDKYSNLTSQEIFHIIDGESSFRSDVVNPDSGAKGLFQITEAAAKEAGINYNTLENMSPEEQLKEYDKYLQRWKYDGSYSLGILQAAPKYRNSSPDTVVYTKKSKGGEVFRLNPQWFNEDGIATVGSINNYYGY